MERKLWLFTFSIEILMSRDVITKDEEGFPTAEQWKTWHEFNLDGIALRPDIARTDISNFVSVIDVFS